MGWDVKRGGAPGGYYYRSVRVPGQPQPVKLYLGRGAEAHAAAAAVEERRAARVAALEAASTPAARAVTHATDLLEDLGRRTRELMVAALVAAGWHRHKGEWRRRRAARGTTHGGGTMSRRTGGRTNSEAANPAYLRTCVRQLTLDATAGDPSARDRLREFLARHPQLVRAIGDLATRVCGAWAEAAGMGDPVAAEAARQEADRMWAECGGAAASVVERMLIENVVACHLAERHAQLVLAQVDPKTGPPAALLRQAESSQRRLHAAVRMLLLARAAERLGGEGRGVATPRPVLSAFPDPQVPDAPRRDEVQSLPT